MQHPHHANPSPAPQASAENVAGTAAQPRFDELLGHLPAGVVVLGADGRILSANRQACALLGAREDELLGVASTAESWHLLRDDGTEMPTAEFPVNQVLRSGEQLGDVVVGLPLPASREPRWLIVNAYPEHDGDGRLARVVVCFTDCSALKSAERALHKNELRLRLALQGSTDAPWDWDLVTGELYYSDRWWDMLGYRPGEIAADNDTWRRLMHPDDLAGVIGFMGALLDGPRQSYSVEFRLCHRDGREVPILSRGCVLRDADGKAVRLSGVNTDLSERKLADQRIHELAYFDPLTGLPNRRHLVEQLAEAQALAAHTGAFGALLFIDLDNFKLLNDTMGHAVGDKLLHEVAQRLRSTLRAGGPGTGGSADIHLARLGGDEFVVVLENLGRDAGEAAAAARRVGDALLAVLGRPYQLGAHVARSTPSIGVTLFTGEAPGIEAPLMQADLAMYRAKADGRNTVRFFEPSMQTQAERRAALEADMRDGLERGEFTMFCQPQFDGAGLLVGAEALVRWRRAGGALAAPGEFIALAEDTGLVVPLGLQMIEQACAALVRWAADPVLGRIKLAVNVSVQQLREPRFLETVAAALVASGADPARLQLEITESVFADDLEVTGERMRALRALGLTFALDDFGTGYSSLAYLKRLPLATIKIDRAFVHDMELHDMELNHTELRDSDLPDSGVDQPGIAIVEAIVVLARKLGLKVVAEGVETEAQRAYLAPCCDALQGFLLGRPVALEEFERRYGQGAGAANSASQNDQ